MSIRLPQTSRDLGRIEEVYRLHAGRRILLWCLPVVGAILTSPLLATIGIPATGDYFSAISVVGMVLVLVWLLIVRLLFVYSRHRLALRVLVSRTGVALVRPPDEWVIPWSHLGTEWQVHFDGRELSLLLPKKVLIFVSRDGETRAVPETVGDFDDLRERVRQELMRNLPEVLPVVPLPTTEAIMAARRHGTSRPRRGGSENIQP
jgi:hypothetical protein